MKEQINVKVFGRVQGVGFRYAVQKRAEELNLKGWVRNRADGSVEAVAAGDGADIEKFLEWIRWRTIFAKIEEVRVEKRKSTENFQRFEIKF